MFVVGCNWIMAFANSDEIAFSLHARPSLVKTLACINLEAFAERSVFRSF